MVYPASVRIGGYCNELGNSTFHKRSSAKIRFNHERRGRNRHLLRHRIRHDYAHRHHILFGFHDEPIQCYRLLAAIGFVDRS